MTQYRWWNVLLLGALATALPAEAQSWARRSDPRWEQDHRNDDRRRDRDREWERSRDRDRDRDWDRDDARDVFWLDRDGLEWRRDRRSGGWLSVRGPSWARDRWRDCRRSRGWRDHDHVIVISPQSRRKVEIYAVPSRC